LVCFYKIDMVELIKLKQNQVISRYIYKVKCYSSTNKKKKKKRKRKDRL
jgi:hypothetical protein